MARKKEDLLKEATDKVAEGMAALGLDVEGKPLQQNTPDASQNAEGNAPGEDTTASTKAPADQPDKPAGDDAVQDPDKAQQQGDRDFQAPPVDQSDASQSQLQQNYDHLRSYADRTSSENAQLRKENAELKSQIQILLTAQPAGQGQPHDKAAAQKEHGADGEDNSGDVGAQAETSTQMDKLANAEQALDALAEEFPDTLAPVVNYLKEFRTMYGDRITNVEQTFNTQVKPVVETITEDTRRRAQDEAETRQKKHYDAITEAFPSWNEMVFGSSTDGNLSPAFEKFLTNHPAGADYMSLLFPTEPGRGASSGMVIQILSEFANSEYGKSIAENLARKRSADAEADLQGDRRAKSMVPDTEMKGTPVDRLKAGQPITRTDLQEIMKICHGDSVKWTELWPFVQKAQAENRIIDTGFVPNTHHL